MSIMDVLALLAEERPAGWVGYKDGSWAPLGRDGWVGPAITATDLIEVARHDLAVLEAAGFITEVIDVEPLSVVDTEHPGGGQANRPALASGPVDPLAVAEPI
ncbi:hypothetical protein ACFV4K_16600 [Nocardia sp. NPDC059764]|uniref:hypothetical protein n=1 Tax=Nocardia sp. NPDC059764 TaxID=3346939 RepID=UPI003651B78C